MSATQRIYDVSPDGQRFVILINDEKVEEVASPHLVVVQNWLSEQLDPRGGGKLQPASSDRFDSA